MKLSVIIPSFQRADLLYYGLNSLLHQQLPDKYEIIVLNDGIIDKTEEVCNSFNNPNIKYIFTGKRNCDGEIKWRIPCYAINIGFKQSQGEFVILTGSEIYHMEKNIITNMLEDLKINPKQLVITEGKDDREGNFLNALKNGGDLKKEYNNLPHRLMTEFPFFMAMERKQVISIGGYDEELGEGYCWDDKDFVDRMICNGAIYKKITCRVVHLYHSRLRYGKSDIKNGWLRNKQMYETKKGIIYRNVGKEWGKFDE